MLPEIPKVDEKTCGARLGSLWNAIVDRLNRQRLISSATVKVADTDRGQRLDKIGGVGTAGTLGLGFEVTYSGASVDVAAGKVLTQTWSGASGTDFKPSDWTTETNYTGDTLSSSATAVWLEVEFTESDTTSEGDLVTETIDLSGGAGGRGGGGGGGGSSNGDPGTYTANPGTNGNAGDTGGAGGAGGTVVFASGGAPATHVGGYGSDGGNGGAGGDGGDGSTVSFTRPTKGVVKVRHYTISSISAHTSKGTASELSTWVKLATISSGVVTQHHIGTLRLTPAAPTFLEP